MTVGEALQLALKQTKAIQEAMRVASEGKPIVSPSGQPMRLQGPQMGDVFQQLLMNSAVTLHMLEGIERMLRGGFVLSDQEANRIAELMVEKWTAMDKDAVQPENDVGIDILTDAARSAGS